MIFPCEGLPRLLTLLSSRTDLVCDFGPFEDIVHEVLWVLKSLIVSSQLTCAA